MISLSEADERIKLLSMIEGKAFEMLIDAFEEQTERIAKRMMDAKTSDQDTLVLKGVLNEAKALDPRVLTRTLVAKMEHKLKKEGMGVVIVKEHLS